MCGIVGFTGRRPGAALLLEGLKKLEYRGYDSAGIATITDGKLVVRKQPGRIASLVEDLDGDMPEGNVGIVHTRWATHGVPNQINAHPHTDSTGSIAIVHNGIIENASAIREALSKKGHVFESDTDTEVLVHLIEEMYEDSLELAVAAALREVDGAFGVAVISAKEPDTIVAARRGSPLLIGIGDGENFVASDAAAIIEHTRFVVYLDDNEIAVITPDEHHVTDIDSKRLEKDVSTVDWDLEAIERGGYPHFMLKEIMEQPQSICNTMRGRLLEEQGSARLNGLAMTDAQLLGFERIILIACGTSWHAALIGEYMLEELARIPTEVEYASEFRYRNPVLDEKTLVIGISQSGETADTLAAIKEAKRRGARTMGIVNSVGSTIAREVDSGVYIHAGPEIGVASTKAFTSQVVALALFTLRMGRLKTISVLEGREIVKALNALPTQVATILETADEIGEVAARFNDADNVLYLGRGFNFPVALEGALKLKEISYVHAEGYPAAEMKHGPIALIDESMPVVFVAPQDGVYQKIISNMQEVKARKGKVIAIVNEDDPELDGLVDAKIFIPATLDALSPVLSAIPLQLFAYHVAVHRGCDVDQPRNLAKSVTVE